MGRTTVRALLTVLVAIVAVSCARADDESTSPVLGEALALSLVHGQEHVLKVDAHLFEGGSARYEVRINIPASVRRQSPSRRSLLGAG